MSVLPEGFAAAIADRYRIDREVGAGGMATVHLAQDIRHHRRVAIKVLRPELGASLGAERFLREIAIAAGLQHPHILPLYDSGEAAGALYYVMPFIEGQTLRERLQRERELPIGEAIRVMREIADAMSAAHAAGVVHRDLKPENVMLSGRHALVADFGVAKAVSESTGRQALTTMGVALGTPSYMAPEQATADPLTDHRADLYALGVIAYEMLTGQPPFVRSTPQAVLAAHVTEAAAPIQAARSTIPPALATLVMRCLEKKPADRPSSADEILQQLESMATPTSGMTPAGGFTPTGTAPVPAWTPSAAATATPALVSGDREHPRGRSGRWRIAAVILVVVGAAGGLWAWRARDTDPAAMSATAELRIPIAVLPFEVRATDAALSSTGVDAGERIAAALGEAGLGPASFARSDDAARDAATRVEGSISQRGSDVELLARVVRARDDRVIWSLGPERVASSDISTGIARLQDRVLGAVGWYANGIGLGSVDPSAFAPPTSLAQMRLAVNVEERIVRGEPGAASLAAEAYMLDTLWPWGAVRRFSFLTQVASQPARSALLARLVEARGSYARGDAALVEVAEAYGQSPERKLQSLRVLAQLEPMFEQQLPSMLLSARRPREVLLLARARDTTSLWAREPGFWDFTEALAHHMLGDFESELAAAARVREARPDALNGWGPLVRALAALGREAALDSVLAQAAGLPSPWARGQLVNTAVLEAQRHGHDELARRLAQQSLQIMTAWSDSARQSVGGRNAVRVAYRTLGDIKRVIALYESEAAAEDRSPGFRLLGMRDRILAGDTAGALALTDMARREPVEAFRAGWTNPGLPRYYAAQVLALLGRKEEAVTMLREALNTGVLLTTDEPLEWFWAPLRDFPPFIELTRLRDGG